MKLFERPTTRNVPERTPEISDHLPELPEGVTVPDDLSTLDRHGATVPHRRTRAVRWLRWVPAVLALGVGAVAVALIVRGDDTTQIREETPWQNVTEGPGSNSLNAVPITPTVIPFPDVVEGPGSNSLNAVPITPTVIPFPNVTVGPGSNSLNAVPITSTVIPFPNVTVGPGSNSLDAVPIAPVIPWPNVTEGPGSNSLAP